MKPRNDLERKLVKMASQLPQITERQKQWAFHNCFEPLALYWRKSHKVKCLCCGAETRWNKTFLDSFIDVDEYHCEECNRSMRIKPKVATAVMNEKAFFSVVTTFKGMQLVRTFEVIREIFWKNRPTCYSINEVYQNWIMPDGKEKLTGVPHSRSAYFVSFSYSSPYVIKNHKASSNGYYQYNDLFNVCGNYFYPSVRITPLVKRNGWRKEIFNLRNSISIVDAISYLLKCPTAEMLCKTGQIDLFRYMIREDKRELDYLHSVRIANRRGYIVNDASMWIDMLQMAYRLGLDTHSPSLVCPEDLKEAHDRILHRYTRRKAISERAKALLNDKQYQRAKSRYFGICLVGEGFNITVLKSVVDVLEEGEAMHHCVYTNEYYEKENSLLLSARDSDGNRIETVELSLKNFKVLQSRSKFNKTSPLHNAIVSLVESNSKLFRKAATS